MVKYDNLTLTRSSPQSELGYPFLVHTHGMALKGFSTLYGLQRWMSLHGLTITSGVVSAVHGAVYSIKGCFYEARLAPFELKSLVQSLPHARSFYRLSADQYRLALTYDDEKGRRCVAYSLSGHRINYWLGRAIEEGLYEDPAAPDTHWLKQPVEAILKAAESLPSDQLLIHEKAVVTRARLEYDSCAVETVVTQSEVTSPTGPMPSARRPPDLHA